jgi:hypothetical protein
MKESEFVALVHRMRTAQKAYFKNRLNRDLQDSKALEKEVDSALSKLIVAGIPLKQESTGKLF